MLRMKLTLLGIPKVTFIHIIYIYIYMLQANGIFI